MKRVFSIPIIFFICFIVIVYFILPKYSDYRKVKDDIAEKQEKLEQTKAYLLSFQNIEEKLKQHEEAMKKIDTALPKEADFASLLNFFQNKTAETGITLKALNESNACKKKDVEDSEFGEICYSINLSGTYSAFNNLLRIIETSARLIEVEELVLERSEDLLNFNLLIKVYTY